MEEEYDHRKKYFRGEIPVEEFVQKETEIAREIIRTRKFLNKEEAMAYARKKYPEKFGENRDRSKD